MEHTTLILVFFEQTSHGKKRILGGIPQLINELKSKVIIKIRLVKLGTIGQFFLTQTRNLHVLFSKF